VIEGEEAFVLSVRLFSQGSLRTKEHQVSRGASASRRITYGNQSRSIGNVNAQADSRRRHQFGAAGSVRIPYKHLKFKIVFWKSAFFSAAQRIGRHDHFWDRASQFP